MTASLPSHMHPSRSFQGLILTLHDYWADYGCVVLQPYDMEVGAGTFHPATTLRALGPKPWKAAYVQPSRRPKDGRYGENPNRLQHYYQYQVILKPNPPNLQELYLGSLKAIGVDPLLHDIRFVEDDWESPTLGAWGLGWECWCDGMEVSQFTYFQQVCGIECAPVSGELTYGLERLAMYVQGVDNVYDLNFNGREGDEKVTYGEVFLQAEQEYSRHNFEFADTAMLLRHFEDAEAECQALLEGRRAARRRRQSALHTHGAAGLRPVHQGEPRLQPARRARRDLGDRAAGLHLSRPQSGEGLRRGVFADRSGRRPCAFARRRGRFHGDPLMALRQQASARRIAHIDGLRAIAVIAVVGYHAGIPGFDGGFVGVDVFFVISGYLIINHIVEGLRDGSFSLMQFYARVPCASCRRCLSCCLPRPSWQRSSSSRRTNGNGSRYRP